MFNDHLYDTPLARLLGPLSVHQPDKKILILAFNELLVGQLIRFAKMVKTLFKKWNKQQVKLPHTAPGVPVKPFAQNGCWGIIVVQRQPLQLYK
jgi:hypothetical protein|tara:strand:- start:67 stop:348 length:282 start_codon:yes stop_codon:yes gene_type:complete